MEFEKEITKDVNMADEKGKKIEIIQSARSAKWKNEKDEVIDIFVQKQPDGKNMLAFGKRENYGNNGKYDNSDGSFTLLSEYTDGLYWSFCYPDQTERLTLEEQKIFNDVMEKYNPDFKKTVSEQLSKNNNEVTADELKNARALLPKEQYQLVLSYTQGEEGEHFKGIIKEISSKAEAIKGKREILTEDKKHPLAFKYTLGNSRFYFSEWDGGDELYGYVVLNGDTQNSEWGYTSLEELKNSGGKARNGFPIMPEMIFYGLEDTIEKQISVDYPELSEQMGIKPKLNHNEELISEFGKEIFETLQSRKLEKNTYNICCAAQFVIRTMDSSEQKEIFSIMKKCGCEGKNGKENTEDFLNEVFNSESKTASAMYSRNRLYEKINNACSSKKKEKNKNIHSPESDYNIYK